jgi:hypothetical protein
MRNDDDRSWNGPLTPGGIGTLTNSVCTLNASSSSASISGNNLTVNFSLTFPTGNLNQVFLLATSLDGQSSGWITAGSWTP